MTRQRIYGSDTEFCAWIRGCKELPSIGHDFGLAVSDNDITLHRYMTSVDSIGTREVQAIMQLEVKTRKGKPPAAQMDTLSKLNMFATQKTTKQGVVRFFGVFILVMSDTTPDNSKLMWWGVIPKTLITADASKLIWKKIDREKLIQLLRFERHPRNFEMQPFRRHHLTRVITETVAMPLGFKVDVPVVRKS